MQTIRQALSAATALLGTQDAQSETVILLCHVLQCNSAHLIAWPDKALETEHYRAFEKLLHLRQQGIPIAYIKGEKEFWSRSFIVNEHTLIPRPETELLIEFMLKQFDATTELKLADLGTGSGAIAVTLACERPRWSITATDISQHALAIAQQNAQRHQAGNINFKQGNWFAALDESQHIIVSNPPYVAQNDVHLKQGDVRFEPAMALHAGNEGLDDIHQLCSKANNYLYPDGWLVLEHGYDQKGPVRQIFENHGFKRILQRDDLCQQPRMTAGQR